MSPERPTYDLAVALDGVRALLLDLDGVIVLRGGLVPGSGEALTEIERRGIPFRIVTNTSLVSRAGLARWGERLGAPIAPERIISALSATAAYTRRRHPAGPLFVLAAPDALTEFAGQRLLSEAEASAPGATAAAVVVGDGGEALTYANMNRAFRLVRTGAELIGMHRNPWWLTADGPTIDSGAYVRGLEFATGRRARILGKPAPDFFRAGAAALTAELTARDEPPLRHAEIAMVGDDIRSDILAAQRVGLRGVFVLTGKHGLHDLGSAAAGRGGGRPDAVASSLAEVVAALP